MPYLFLAFAFLMEKAGIKPWVCRRNVKMQKSTLACRIDRSFESFPHGDREKVLYQLILYKITEMRMF